MREVTAAAWTDDGPTPDGEGRRWRFEISAGSFLHNMVRVAVGSMVDVAQGRMTLEEFAAALASGERRRMGQTAPARGLALVARALRGRAGRERLTQGCGRGRRRAAAPASLPEEPGRSTFCLAASLGRQHDGLSVVAPAELALHAPASCRRWRAT